MVTHKYNDKRTMQVHIFTYEVLVLEHFSIRTFWWLFTLILTRVNIGYSTGLKDSQVLYYRN